MTTNKRTSTRAVALCTSIRLLCLLTAAALLSAGEDQRGSPDVVSFKTLVNFNGANGSMFQGTGLYPTQGLDGNLYGTTLCGGANTATFCFSGLGPGTFFKMSPAGKLTTLYSFCSEANCADGAEPEIAGTVTLGTDGNFYGGALNGGAYGWGTLFKITTSGSLTTLYSFCPDNPTCMNGDTILNGLVEAVDGNFYGVTGGGGGGTCGAGVNGVGCGTVFRVTPQGSFTRIYSFCSQPNCADGISPATGLLAASDG